MPASYTHYQFGQDVLKRLNEETRPEKRKMVNMINENIDVFSIGLNGPDIFFFYKALSSNPIKSLGHDMHDESAFDFFAKSAKTINLLTHYKDELSYMMGFVCHFVLDSECHSYIEHRISATGVSHTEIETAFEKHIMQKNGIDPLKYNAASHINTDLRCCKTVAEIFSLKIVDVKKALKSMVRINHFFLPANPIQDFIVKTVLKLSGDYHELKGLLMARPVDKSCEQTNLELTRRYNGAIDLAVELIHNYYDFYNKQAELSPRFDRTFSFYDEEMKKYAALD